jgi:hypothetical protein
VELTDNSPALVVLEGVHQGKKVRVALVLEHLR